MTGSDTALQEKRPERFVPGVNDLSGFAGGQVLADHQGHLEDDGVVELAQVQPGELLDLLQTVDHAIVFKVALMVRKYLTSRETR